MADEELNCMPSMDLCVPHAYYKYIQNLLIITSCLIMDLGIHTS